MSEPHPIVKKLHEMRVADFLSQREVAERTGVHQGSISEIERGLIQPNVATVVRLADVFDCDVVLVPRGRALRTEYGWAPEGDASDVRVSHQLLPSARERWVRQCVTDHGGSVFEREVTEWRQEP